ncbi:TPA: PadR family transcriptional regulator [Escherichia coli]|uniref:PadR family transcriptional regulator n=1 Tax=Escherichia coli TaxID=562 RepID=UPI002948BAC9|nr:helix-turn-helix transcriptional regulator [Escherichia coli]
MTDKDLYGGLIRLHILHHAAEEPVFGLGIIEELRRHGYEMSAGTVYPMLHGLEKKGYLTSRGSVAKIVKLEHAWRRLDGRNDDGFQVAPFPG